MRCHDAKRGKPVQRGEHLAQLAEQSRQGEDVRASSCAFGQDATPAENPPSRPCSGISTARIMYAVERQRRITQQLDDLRAQQQQRTAFLRTTGLKLLAWIGGTLGLVVSMCLVGLVFQPVLLVRTLTLFSGFIALLLALGVDIQEGLALIPSNNWVLSGAALVVVLMMFMWLRLMRYPHEV
ncbi:MAG: hypothetical protein ACRDHZ_15145 [Ktedonobacteraceae bacterium]